MTMCKQSENAPWNVCLIVRRDVDDLIFEQEAEYTKSER